MVDKVVEHHRRNGIQQFQEGGYRRFHISQAVIIKEDSTRTRGQADEHHEEPVALRDQGEIEEMPSHQHDHQHDERGEAIAEEGGGHEGIVAQDLLGEHRGTAERKCRQQRQQGRIHRGNAVGAEIGQAPAKGHEIARNERDGSPQGEILLHPFLQDDARQQDGKHRLQLLQEYDDRQVVEVQQEERLHDSQCSQGAAEERHQQEEQQVRTGHGLQMPVFPEEEQVHQHKGKQVQQKHDERGVEVVELRGKQDAVNAP